jgi:hypothetical protein
MGITRGAVVAISLWGKVHRYMGDKKFLEGHTATGLGSFNPDR